MSTWRAVRSTGKRAWRQPSQNGCTERSEHCEFFERELLSDAPVQEGEKGYPARRWRPKPAVLSPPSQTVALARPVTPKDSNARVVWLLGNRCVELLLPSGAVRCSTLPAAIKAGSRSVADVAIPGRFYVLENGSSRVWQVDLGLGPPKPLGDEAEAWRFRASLGSRLVSCGPENRWLLVTGTPHHGAHSPWLFDLDSLRWEALPAAPHAILSSAVAVQPGTSEVTILGGWSKMSSCHGHVQRLMPGPSWN